MKTGESKERKASNLRSRYHGLVQEKLVSREVCSRGSGHKGEEVHGITTDSIGKDVV